MAEMITVKIEDKDVKFAPLGRKFRVCAAKKIRELRYESFKAIISSMSSDAVAVSAQASSAIDACMASVVISDQEINSWLGTPEGFFYQFCESAKKADPKLDESAIESLYDSIDDENLLKLRDPWELSTYGGRWGEMVSSWQRQVELQVGVTTEDLEEFRKWKESQTEESQDAPEAPAETE